MLTAYSHQVPRPRVSRYHVSLAVDDAEIHEAQRLRFEVFAEEMGARLPHAESGLDRDLYDAHCDHLLVRDRRDGGVVGTYRILTPEAARRAGGYYAEQQFDLSRLQGLRPHMAEIGRACVHHAHRSGTVIARLWIGLAEYMTRYGYQSVVGCARIGLGDGGQHAAAVYRQLRDRHLSTWRATPHARLPVEDLDDDKRSMVPPLIRSYVRFGASLCGEPAVAADCNAADLLLLLPVAQLNRDYARRLLSQ